MKRIMLLTALGWLVTVHVLDRAITRAVTTAWRPAP